MRMIIAGGRVRAGGGGGGGGEKRSLLKSGRTVAQPVGEQQEKDAGRAPQDSVADVSLIAVPKPEPRTFEVEDIITIIVREESESTSEAEAETEKDFSVNADLKEWIKLHHKGTLRLQPDEGIASLNPKIDVSMDREYEGSGEAERKDSFLTKIAAKVIDVKPNGNMTLEASRFIKSDDEEITLTLTGEASPKDVNADRTIQSTDVANLTVSKTTQGIARDGQKRGWLVKILDLINPF